MTFKPQTEKEVLAVDIAYKLSDLPNIPLYISYANKYPESLLRKALGEALEIPLSKIRKTRGALFNHLVQKYAKQSNPGD